MNKVTWNLIGPIFLLLTVNAPNALAVTVVSWDLQDYNNDGLQSDISFGPSVVTPPTGNSSNGFGFTGEVGCTNASDGNTCDPITFDSGAIGTNVFASGFILNGGATVLPKTSGSMSADITGGTLTFSSLPFAILQPGPSVGIDVFLPPGSFPVFGSSTNTNADFSFLTVEDLTSLGNSQYGVVVRWSHQGPSCLGCFDSLEAQLRLEGVMTVVPVPPAIWLFGSGLLGLVSIARRKKAA
jgi:hypothetical protein